MPIPTTPGTYLYTDPMPGAQPERLQLDLDGDELVAIFKDLVEGDVSVRVADMAGEFQPAP